MPSSCDKRWPTRASESASVSTPSVGRPRWEVTMTAAPLSSARRMPGTEARMRVSSLIWPASSNGTLRSARMNTRLPCSAPALASADRVLTLAMMDYLADISATVVSSMRFEKPHSLSYHDETLTSLPETLVSVASKLLEAGLWLKSTDTDGSLL